MFRRWASTGLPPTIRQLLSSQSNPASPIQVHGWIKSIRRQKRVSFAVITDGSSAQGLQTVFSDTDLAKRLTNGASVRLTGKLIDSPGTGQNRELQVDSCEVLGECDPETYPIQKQALSINYLREHAHLRARTDTNSAILRLRGSALRSLHKYFESEGFCYAHTPIITSNDCEGAGETFRIAPVGKSPLDPLSGREFFSQPSYLTVSSQLHLEALASAISRVYTISPCFRAERSQTNRHLAEFWMLEAEWAFTYTVDELCHVVENTLKTILKNLNGEISSLYEGRDDVKRKAIEAAGDSKTAWPRISYSDAILELKKYQMSSGAFEFEPLWGAELHSEHEKWLSEQFIHGPVFVTDYPASLKPFYMRLNDDGKTVACFDLLVPHVGELAGGSLREERLPLLEHSLEMHGLNQEDYTWYLDLRQYGGAPHGGFGMGFERLISWLSGTENIRECIPMPRWSGRMLL